MGGRRAQPTAARGPAFRPRAHRARRRRAAWISIVSEWIGDDGQWRHLRAPHKAAQTAAAERRLVLRRVLLDVLKERRMASQMQNHPLPPEESRDAPRSAMRRPRHGQGGTTSDDPVSTRTPSTVPPSTVPPSTVPPSTVTPPRTRRRRKPQRNPKPPKKRTGKKRTTPKRGALKKHAPHKKRRD